MIPAAFATRRWRPGPRIVLIDHEALRVTVEPLDVTYTSSRPARSTSAPPALWISANSSEADAPAVCTSETTRVEIGHATAAAAMADRGTTGSGRRAADTNAVTMTARTSASSA